MRQERLLVLGCAPRSGSTWLQLLLYNTGAIATANETGLFPGHLGPMDRLWQMQARRAGTPGRFRDIGLGQLMTRAEFTALCRRFARPVLQKIADTAPERPYLLEKSPDNVLHFPFIRELFPQARLVHLVRDPRAVVASTQAARDWAGPWAKAPAHDHVVLWKKCVTRAREMAGNGRMAEIRYEDLHADPVQAVVRLCRTLRLRIAPERIAAAVEACRIENLQAGTAPSPWPLAGEPPAFFRHGDPQGWRHELDARTIGKIERMTRTERGWHGYADHRP